MDKLATTPVLLPPGREKLEDYAGDAPLIWDTSANESIFQLAGEGAYSVKNAAKKRMAWLIAGDAVGFILAVAIGWFFAEIVRFIAMSPADTVTEALPLMTAYVMFGLPFLVCTVLSRSWGHYTRFQPSWNELRDLIKIVMYIAALNSIFLFAVKGHFSRLWLVSFWSLIIVMVPIMRICTKKFLIKRGIWFRPTLIIGVGKNAAKVAQALKSDRYMGHRIIGFIDPANDSALLEDALFKFRLANKGEYEAAKGEASFEDIHVVFAFDTMDEFAAHRATFDQWSAEASSVTLAPPIFGLPLCDAEVISVFKKDSLIIRIHNQLRSPWIRLVKRVFDFSVALLISLLITPILLIFCLIVKMDGGPVIFAHKRIGFNGRSFSCYKFRTMVVNADEVLDDLLKSDPDFKVQWSTDFKLKNDPRVTGFGRILRAMSLDELPQLWNVLKGDMSLVGPRPIVEEEIVRYGDSFDCYIDAKPGMTGLWQVSGRNDVSYSERVELDTWYIRNWSFWNDVVILLKTVPIVLGKRGAY